jgi:hypothetical protein
MSTLPWKRSWFGQRWLAVAAVAVALTSVAGGEAASAATSSGSCGGSLRATATTCGSGGMHTQGVRWQ